VSSIAEFGRDQNPVRYFSLSQWRSIVLSRFGPPAKMRLVLVTLGEYVNSLHLDAYPSQRLLAERAGCSDTSVRNLLREAEEAGWLKSHKFESGTSWPQFKYWLSMPEYAYEELPNKPWKKRAKDARARKKSSHTPTEKQRLSRLNNLRTPPPKNFRTPLPKNNAASDRRTTPVPTEEQHGSPPKNFRSNSFINSLGDSSKKIRPLAGELLKPHEKREAKNELMTLAEQAAEKEKQMADINAKMQSADGQDQK